MEIARKKQRHSQNGLLDKVGSVVLIHWVVNGLHRMHSAVRQTSSNIWRSGSSSSVARFLHRSSIVSMTSDADRSTNTHFAPCNSKKQLIEIANIAAGDENNNKCPNYSLRQVQRLPWTAWRCRDGVWCLWVLVVYAGDLILLPLSVVHLENFSNELNWLDMAINYKKSCCLRIGPRCDMGHVAWCK